MKSQTLFGRLRKMRRFLLISSFFTVLGLCSAEDKFITFQDLSSVLYSNVTVIKRSEEGVMLRFGNEYRYARVPFTNMSEQAQLLCGYDLKKLMQQRERKTAMEKLAREQVLILREQRETAIKSAQELEIFILSRLVYPIGVVDFPKTDSAKATCKELVAELKGVNTGLTIGLSYNKFSDLFTDTVIKIQKTRDLTKDELPPVFQTRMDACIKIYNDSRNEWKEKIDSKTEETKAWREYFMQKAWAESTIHLTMLMGIVDNRTNVNELAINQAIDLVKHEKQAFNSGILPNSLRSFKSISLLPDEEILKRLNEKPDPK